MLNDLTITNNRDCLVLFLNKRKRNLLQITSITFLNFFCPHQIVWSLFLYGVHWGRFWRDALREASVDFICCCIVWWRTHTIVGKERSMYGCWSRMLLINNSTTYFRRLFFLLKFSNWNIDFHSIVFISIQKISINRSALPFQGPLVCRSASLTPNCLISVLLLMWLYNQRLVKVGNLRTEIFTRTYPGNSLAII